MSAHHQYPVVRVDVLENPFEFVLAVLSALPEFFADAAILNIDGKDAIGGSRYHADNILPSIAFCKRPSG